MSTESFVEHAASDTAKRWPGLVEHVRECWRVASRSAGRRVWRDRCRRLLLEWIAGAEEAGFVEARRCVAALVRPQSDTNVLEAAFAMSSILAPRTGQELAQRRRQRAAEWARAFAANGEEARHG